VTDVDDVDDHDDANADDVDAGDDDDANADDVDDVDADDEHEDANRIPAATAMAVLEFLTKAMVDDPDAVEIDLEERRGRGRGPVTTLAVHVAPSDMGRVIGKRGRIAGAIRTVVRAAAVRDGIEVDVDFVD
jgi:predicted RNA-binding protein YlqC (UPF0109 family)